MNKNMGTVDKIARVIIGAIVAALYLMNIISGITGIILLVAAAILVLTSIFRFCPIYALFGLSTCSTENL